MCKKYNDGAETHHQLARLCARAGRELALAEQNARRAVSLAPKKAAYRDTLAEALFWNGQRDAAVDEMVYCTELEPANAYFKKQLARFRNPTGNTAAPEEE